MTNDHPRFNILCLDGGGAKGFYTLGILRELEAALGKPLTTCFQAIYGTSTGAIIASLIGLGKSAKEALSLYQEHVPRILGPKNAKGRSAELKRVASELYAGYAWEDFRVLVGIVATNWTRERPLIFKNDVGSAYGLKSTFVPGFGCTISDAVQASCSATPFFRPSILTLTNDGIVEARDGGFCANNPSLFAVSDALNALKVPAINIRVLTLGVGHYPEPRGTFISRWVRKLEPIRILQRTLNVSANTAEIQLKLLLPNIQHVRISDAFTSPDMAMDFLESDVRRLDLLIQRGRDSFSRYENQVRELIQ